MAKDDSTVDGNDLTKKQLQALARKRGVEYSKSDTKKELLEKLEGTSSSGKSDDSETSSPGGANPKAGATGVVTPADGTVRPAEPGDRTPDAPAGAVVEGRTTFSQVATAREGSPPDLGIVPDEKEAAEERVGGRTSDAKNREAGVTAAEVPPDRSSGPKASDAGPDLYPFPPGGDVDVATVDPGSGEGEYMKPLDVEDWVTLGEHEHVPERFEGRMAAVIEAPRNFYKVGDEDNVWITVRTRDEANATLYIPLSAVKSIHRGGRYAGLPVG